MKTKIYTDNQDRIVAVGSTDRTDVTEYEVDSEMFGNMCEAVIFGYKYGPVYLCKYGEDGNEILDPETNEPIYELDERGNPVIAGIQFVPFVPDVVLDRIQFINDKSEEENAALIECIVDNDFRMSMIELGLV